MTRTEQVQAILEAYTSGDLVRLEFLRHSVDDEIFLEGMQLVLATQPLELESRMRKVESYVFLAQHTPAGISIPDAVEMLSPDELLEYVRILDGGVE